MGLCLFRKHCTPFSWCLFLLSGCAIYGSFYSIQLLLQTDDKSAIETGWHLREVHEAKDISQVMIVTSESNLGGAIAIINSIASNTKSPVYFFIATDNATMKHLWSWIEKSKLSQLEYEIKGLTEEWLRKKTNSSGNIDKLLQYSRLFINEIFPNLKGRVVILDDDMIVQGDISELFNFPIKENHTAALSNNCDPISRTYNYKGGKYGEIMYLFKKALKSKKIKPSTCVLNIDVMVLDIDGWDGLNITAKTLVLLEANKKDKIFKTEGVYSPLIVNLYNKTTDLDPFWHVRNLGLTSGSRYSQQFVAKAKLLHWNGQFKPWRRNSPYTDIWDRYYVPDPTGLFNPSRKVIPL